MSSSTSSNKLIYTVVSLVGLVVVAFFIYYIVMPVSAEFIATNFSNGVGFKSASVISFFVSIAMIVLFAIAGGDGLLGEIQYMFGAFFTLFFTLWLLIAWIF